MSAKHGMARGTRGGFGKNSYNQLPWDAAGDDCSPASTLGSSGQSKHMKINWATIAYNRNQVKQKASTCKWFRSSVKYIWGLKHASVPKGGETCIAEPTTSLPKYSVGFSWLLVGRWPAYYFFQESCLSVVPWNIYVCWCVERREGQHYRCVCWFLLQKIYFL